MSYKHFSFEERSVIEDYLNKGISVHQISKKLKRSDSSVVREIKRHRFRTNNQFRSYVPCIFKRTEMCEYHHVCGDMECKKDCSYCTITGSNCGPKCVSYHPRECDSLKKSPFVCNGCHECDDAPKRCLRFRYDAVKAEKLYRKGLSESREGIAIGVEEMEKLDNLVSPLLLNGQSINVIYMNHYKEIPCSASTLYSYVDKCYLTARNIDMPRKVRFKKRYSHGNRPVSLQAFAIDRKYSDFKAYTQENPDLNIWEMDTVIGSEGGKCLLTLLFRKSSFMIAFLLENHTQNAVIETLNDISDWIGIENFQNLFQVILTDRGTEFSNPLALECDRNGEFKTKVYYCDPYCSWQKGMIERNHEFIRMVLPKGKSFDNLSQREILLLMNHINNYPRDGLNGCTPYELSKLLIGKEFLRKMKYHEIPPDSVILKPKLLWLPNESK